MTASRSVGGAVSGSTTFAPAPRRLEGAIGLPVTWILTLPLAVVGGGIAAGADWLVVGWMLRHERHERLERAATCSLATA